MKACKRCGSTEFYSGYKCKACHAKAAAQWAIDNPEKDRARRAAYKAANKEKIKAAATAHYVANRERLVAKAAQYRAEHPDKARQTRNRSRASSPEAHRIHEQNRSARKRANGGILSKGLTAKLFKLQKGKCACCGLPLGSDYHLDHIMPIALGGSNLDDNIQLLKKRCNLQKRAIHPIEFMQSRGKLL